MTSPSPLRYPGGKSWLIPCAREWLSNRDRETIETTIVEPFAGGASVSLAAILEGRAQRAILIEKDPDVAAFWKAAVYHNDAMIDRVLAFQCDREHVEQIERDASSDPVDRGFRTLVLNRCRTGGILHPGAGLLKRGDRDRGIRSRWYPDTLAARLRAIGAHANQIAVVEGDGVETLSEDRDSSTRYFIDPPYPGAGPKLYLHGTVDHARIFDALSSCAIEFLMTYDCSAEIDSLAQAHGFHVEDVSMTDRHHQRRTEKIITRAPFRRAGPVQLGLFDL